MLSQQLDSPNSLTYFEGKCVPLSIWNGWIPIRNPIDSSIQAHCFATLNIGTQKQVNE